MRWSFSRRFGSAFVAGLVVLVAAAGCNADAAAEPGDKNQPAGASGRACQVIEYGVVENILGVRFDVAGGAQVESTYTCVLTRAGEEYPDLTLAMTTTAADELIFRALLTPAGAADVPELGRGAFQLPLPAAGSGGPGAEVDWLSAKGKLMVLRYTAAATVTAEKVALMLPALIDLAKRIEAALIKAG